MSTVTAPPIIAIASGKGGAGKTSFTLNLATTLAKMGKSVCVFDGDIGLANVDVQLGITPDKDLSHVIQGKADIADVVVKCDKGFYIIPGRSGFEKNPFMTNTERRNILNSLRTLSNDFDVMFIDVAAGVDNEVLGLANFADRTILVTTPDPSSITDAYAVIKLLKKRYERENCEILINQAGNEIEGRKTYEKLKTAGENFLGVQLPLVGIIPYDRQYTAAVKMQQLTVEAFADGPAAHAIRDVARKLLV